MKNRHYDSTHWWIAVSLLLSVAVHALGVFLARFAGGAIHANEPLHSFVETSGSVIGLGVALLLLAMDRVGRGATSNAPLVLGLGTMAVLDALHAIVSPGESFVWLHSTATFAGGLLFASVWVLPRGGGYRLNSITAALLLLATLLLPMLSERSLRMVADGHFTPLAAFLNIGGGGLMLVAAARYLRFYSKHENTDDLLFAVHCLLFGGAAIMFEQSTLWDFSWWWWHVLRLVAYVVALTFAVRTILQLAMDFRRRADHAVDQALKAANDGELLRHTFDKHTIYSITDRSGKILEVNEGFCRISGYRRDELIGQNHRIVNSGFHPREFWIGVWRTIASGKPWRGEVCNRAKDGSIYWVDSTIVPWRGADGRPDRYVSLRIDITAAKQVEAERERLAEKIADQEQLLQTVIDSVSDGIVAEDEHGSFLLFNQSAADLLVENAAAPPPSGWDDLPALLQTDGETPLRPDELPTRRALEGEEVFDQELLVQRSDGDRRVSCNAAPLVSDSHRGAVVVMRDTTEVERMRRQLQQAQKLESLGQLSAGVAHEINTPLQSVIANVMFLTDTQPRLVETIDELLALLEKLEERSGEAGRARELAKRNRCEYFAQQSLMAIEDVAGASQKVSQIVRAMKNVAHPGGDEHSPFDLNDVLSDAATITRNRWKDSATLNLELDEGLAFAYGSRSEISQVVINLVVNAADALEEHLAGTGGMGEITIRSEQRPDGSVLFCVADNGPGIPEKIASRVFDPFFTTKEVGKGSGQGLAICYDIVANRHQGSIVIDSPPDGGARFTVTLPTEAPAARPKPDQEAASRDGAMV